MNKLSQEIINELVRDFIPRTTDEGKQSVIDRLGLLPSNHARFVLALAERIGTDHISAKYAFQDYFRLCAF